MGVLSVQYLHCYSEIPLFQGMKSSCAKRTAAVISSPLATLIIYSKSSSPLLSMVSSPVMIEPVLKSMMSFIRFVNAWLLAIFITGAIGFPVGVPNPVVKHIMVQPDPASPVVLSTSLPGVQSKFNPFLVAFSV